MAKKKEEDSRPQQPPASGRRQPGPALPGAGLHHPRSILRAAAASVSTGKDFPSVPEGQKPLQRSSFNSGEEELRRQAQLPNVWNGPLPEQLFEEEQPVPFFDGTQPAPEVTERDVWKAIRPRVESREGCRSPEQYAQVLNQFAVGHNPRYAPDGPERPRAHIFIWDVTRAMGAEVPHLLGPRELSLSQTTDWIRYEGSERGWVRIMSLERALMLAGEGKPVILVPKERGFKPQLLAMVRPERPGADGLLRVAGAGIQRGNDLSPREVIGPIAFDYFSHP